MQQIVKSKRGASSPLMPANPGKDERYRLGRYERWLATTGTPWYRPNLQEYADAQLERGLAGSTVNAHLSTIRARYRKVLDEHQRFYEMARAELERTEQEDTPANRRAVAMAIRDSITAACKPDAVDVETITVQDRADSEFIRLTRAQANQFIAAPGVDTIQGLRDTALIAFALSTGLREAELRALDVDDLRQRLSGELAVRVKKGKGAKKRLVPYGAMDSVLVYVDAWLKAAGITEGAVFCSFYKGGSLRGRLSLRAIQIIIGGYQVAIDGELRSVKPHDCRRTYARRCADLGMELLAIKDNLGHASLETTILYVGELDADRRKPGELYDFDFTGLNGG